MWLSVLRAGDKGVIGHSLNSMAWEGFSSLRDPGIVWW